MQQVAIDFLTHHASSKITSDELAPVAVRLLDLNVVVRSDSSAFLDRLRASYANFIVNEFCTSATENVVCGLFVGCDTPWRKPIFFVGEEQFDLPKSDALPYELIISIIFVKLFHRVRNFYLIHAGVVAKGNQAVLIVADSNQGKSTLVYELARRGLRLYTDDTAAVAKDTGQVSPFPRTLQLRPGTLEVMKLEQNAQSVSRWSHKYLVNDLDYDFVGLEERAEVQSIVFLRDPTKQDTTDPNLSKYESVIVLESVNDDLLELIRLLPDLIKMDVYDDQGYPILNVVTVGKNQAVQQITEICREQGIAVLYAGKGMPNKPSFESPARLYPLSRSQAVLDLLPHVHREDASARGEEPINVSPLHYYTEVAGFVKSANCYVLEVGPLQQMAELVTRLFDNPQ